MGRQREKERLLCGQPVCEEVGRAPVASQWASVNHMAPSLSPSHSFFSPSDGGTVSAALALHSRWPLGLLSSEHTLRKARGGILIKPCWRDTAKITHTHMCIPYTRAHTQKNTPFFVASSSARLPCGQTKEKTFCINQIFPGHMC